VEVVVCHLAAGSHVRRAERVVTFERPLSRRAALGLGAGAVLWAGMPAAAAGAAPKVADDEVFARAETHRVGQFVLQVATWSGAAALRVTHAT
jgi:hypothetical protein